MIIGAGIFALPYTVVKAGLFWSYIHFIATAALVTITHIIYGDVFLTHGDHLRLPGFVRKYFGMKAYFVVLLSRLSSYFGYLLIYGVLGGIFLHNIVPVASPWVLSILFFVGLAPLLLLRTRDISVANLVLTVPLILFSIILFIRGSQSHVSFAVEARPEYWFLPYGVFLFAFSGASVIPEVVDIVGRKRRDLFRIAVILSTLIVSLVYILFTAGILRIAGLDVPSDAISVLRSSEFRMLFLFASWFGIFALVTSHLSLGLELRYTLEYDLKISRFVAWSLIALVPLFLFLGGIDQFVFIISFIGAIGVGIEGVAIASLGYRAGHARAWLACLLIFALTLGAFIELAKTFHLV